MSGFCTVPRWAPIRVGDAAVQRSLDFSGQLNPSCVTPPADTIASIGALGILRVDGVAMTSVDLVQAGTLAPDATKQVVKLALTPGQPGIEYIVTGTIISAGGQTLVCDALQPVTSFLGAEGA